MKTKKDIIKPLLLCWAFCVLPNLNAQDVPGETKIGIITDYESARLYFAPMIINETKRLVGSRHNIQFPEDRVVSGDFDFDKLKEYVREFMADDELDIVIGIGGLVSEILAKSGPFAKPVVANGVFHPELQNIPMTPANTSGVENFGYTLISLSMERDLESFYSIYPFKNLGFLLFEEYINSIPAINDYFFSFIQKYDAVAQIIPFGRDYRQAIENLPGDLDAIYVGLLYDYTLEELQECINLLNDKKLPTFAMVGRPYVDLGILAGAAAGSNLQNLSRRAALDIEKILDGEDPAGFSVTVEYKDELVFNMKSARKIDFFPSFATLSQAEILFEEEREHARMLTFPGLIAELLENNLNLRVASQEVLAGSNEINKARSNLLPQVNVSASNIIIDKTRAEGSFGMNAQKSTIGSGQLSQILFSEPAFAKVRIEKILQEKRNYDFSQKELDLVLQAGEAYMNVLKAQAYEKVLKENLNLTRKHLDIARLRQEVGFSGVSDVFRWESEIALVSIEVVHARAQKKAAEFALNEILNRPLVETFVAEDLTRDDSFIRGEHMEALISNARTWKYFINFMVTESLERSPELKQLDQYIAVQERLKKLNLRSRYLPTVGFQSQGDYYISRRGAGTEPMDPIIIPGMDPISIGTEVEDYQWNIGITASLPIFQGGYKDAEIRQSEIDISILTDRRNDLANKIAQRSITSFEFIGASSPAMDMASQAAEAANKSLVLSQDAYSKGQISIVDLIDVQKAAIQSNLLQANSVYDYLIDYLRVSRATGIFLFLLNGDEKTELMSRLLQYMAIHAPNEIM
ncbi:ABC transporter substrate binding protein [Bacteroidota bacterium]